MAQVNCGLRGSHTGAVLLHRELRVAHFDAHLVFQLLQSHLGLAIFQFRTDLRRLRHPIAQRNGQAQPHALVGSGRIHQLSQSIAVADRAATAEGRRGIGRIEAELKGAYHRRQGR